jgi:hypothetical protein
LTNNPAAASDKSASEVGSGTAGDSSAAEGSAAPLPAPNPDKTLPKLDFQKS